MKTILELIEESKRIEGWKITSGLLEIINEKHGVFPNGDKLANYIYLKIEDYIDKKQDYKFDITKSDCKWLFIDKLTIDFHYRPGDCEGEFNLIKYLNKEEFEIAIFANKITSRSEIVGMLLHELTHIYNEVESLKHQDEDILKGEKNAKRMASRLMKVGYFGYLSNDKKGNEKIVNQILYYLNKDEVNSFVSQTLGEIDIENIETPSEALDELRDSFYWTTLEKIEKILEGALKNQNVQDIFYQEYIKVFPETKVSSKRLIQRLLHLVKKIKNKIISHLGKRLSESYVFDKSFIIR